MAIIKRLTPIAAVSLLLILVNLICVILAPWIAPYGESQSVGSVWLSPNAEFWLGLDNLGRDMWSRLLYGGRTTISLALIITGLAFAIGIGTGFAAAVAPRKVDTVLSRINDTFMSIPSLITALIIISVLGTSISVLICSITFIEATRVFRVARSVAMNIAVLEFVEAARLRGEGWWWLIRREILPNSLPPLIAEFGLRFCFAFLFIASLSFLGLGIQPPYADWGSMVRENAAAINFGGIAPLMPAAAIALLTISVNLVIDWFLSIHGRVHGEGA
jgi:peptide/nickel transport system permease protein